MEKNRTYTILVALVVALGGFLLGFDSAVISGAVPFIQKYFTLSDMQLGWAVSCLIFGAMAGNALAGPASDRFGRKKVLIFTAVFFCTFCNHICTGAGFLVFYSGQNVRRVRCRRRNSDCTHLYC